MENKKYYLGLDLGIGSVGWAVMVKHNEEYKIDDFGVRLFDCAENAKSGITNAEERRNFRSSRRLIRRRKQRIKDVKSFLQANNLIDKQSIDAFYKNFKVTNNINYDESVNFNPYVIRVKGLTKKLTPEELAVALINIAKRRGYNDKFSLVDDEKNKTKLDDSIKGASNKVQQYKTIAQAIIEDEEFKHEKNPLTLGLIRNQKPKEEKANSKNQDKESSGYRFLFSREDYRNELFLILEKQAQFYPELTKEKINYIIDDVILRQRDFEDGPGPKNVIKNEKWKAHMNKKPHRFFQSFEAMRGNCTFYREAKRGYKSSLTFEIFQMVSALSTFTVNNLNEEQTKVVASGILNLIKNGDIPNKTSVKKIIQEFTDFNNFKDNSAWNNKNANFEFHYLKFMKTILPNQFSTIDFNNLNEHIFDEIGAILHHNITPQKRKTKLKEFLLQKNIILNEIEIEEFLKLQYKKISVSTSNTSFKFMQDAINSFFEQGISYGKFQGEFIKNNEDKMFSFNKDVFTKLFQPIKDEDMNRNAVVFRAVNQARKIIKALHNHYGIFFDVINVEVAKEMAKSFSDRKKIKYENDANQEKNIEYELKLQNEGIKPTSVNVKKYRLWIQQNKRCIYCLNHDEIKVEQIGQWKSVELDHIIPQSVMSDDSLNNMVLACAKCNQEKGNQTPLEWLKNDEKRKISFLNFCNKTIRNNINDKKYEYLMAKDINDEVVEGFASRNLNDTRYITRYVHNWLKKEFHNWELKTGEIVPTKVQTINGMVTSRFRRLWLRFSPWGLDSKVREITPFHHAVDAIILTQFISTSYVSFANDIANIMNLKQQRYKYITNQEYEESCANILKKWDLGKINVPHAKERLKKIIYSEKTNLKVVSPLVPNLKEVIENRIPVILTTEEVEKTVEIKNKGKSENSIPNQIIKRKQWVPKFVEVLNQEEYKEKLAKLNQEYSYPFISYKTNAKISGAITSSQMPINTRYEWKKDKIDKDKKIKIKRLLKNNDGTLKENYSESYMIDKNDNVWEIDTYYGVAINLKNGKINSEWIRKIHAHSKLKSFKEQKVEVLIPRNIVEYTDKKSNKKVMKILNGKTGSRVTSNILGTINASDEKKSLEKYGSGNFRDSLSNWEKDFKILKPSILGKIVTN